MPQERRERTPGRLGHGDAQRLEQRAQHGDALVDVPADQELGRGQPLQLERLRRIGRAGRGLVGLRRLGAPAGVGQGVAQLPLQATGLLRRSRVECQRGPIQPSGVIERQRRRRLVGAACIILARPGRIAGPSIMTGEDLRVHRPCGRQEHRQPFVLPPQAVRG